jgi:cysteine desulfurase/selenocysteine lyase
MDIHRIRQDFPLLKDNDKKAVIYLDNACQSLRPQVVLDVMNRYYSEMSACSGRSMHHLAARVTQQVDESRQTLAKFLGADRKEEIIFTRNTTEGINLVANSLQLSEGDVVVLTDKEHNSNLIPWQMLAKRKKVILRFAKSTPDNCFDPDSFASVMDEKVKLVSVGATSNLDGVSLPVTDIIQKSH